MTMIWATPDEVRDLWALNTSAYGADEWPPLSEDDAVLQVQITSAARILGTKVIRWPILDDDDRPEDVEQRGHVVAAVAEVIRDRLRHVKAVVEVGGTGSAQIIASGGRVKAGNLEVQGGNGGGSWLADRSRVPVDALFALQAAGLIGGSVPTC